MIDNHSTRPKLESQLRVMYDRVAAATPPLGDLRQVRRDHSRPRRHLVGPLCAVATVVAVAGLSATAIHAWGQQSDDDSVRPGPAVGPRVGLIVRVADSLVPQARIRGVLDLNADGCVTLDGLLLIAPAGSEVLDDTSGIAFPGLGPVRFGTTIEGSGGIAQSPTDADVTDPLGCVSADPDDAYLIFYP